MDVGAAAREAFVFFERPNALGIAEAFFFDAASDDADEAAPAAMIVRSAPRAAPSRDHHLARCVSADDGARVRLAVFRRGQRNRARAELGDRAIDRFFQRRVDVFGSHAHAINAAGGRPLPKLVFTRDASTSLGQLDAEPKPHVGEDR